MNTVADEFADITPVTAWKLCLCLFTGKYAPNQLWNTRKFRFKFFARSFIMPFSTRKLLKFITEHPHYEQLLAAQPRLPCRLHRPYLSLSMTRRESINAIFYHYKLIEEIFGSDRFLQHLSEGLCLAEFNGKTGEGYQVIFISTHKLDREGESSLRLRTQTGDMLCEMTFTIYEKSGERALMIGGVQGPSGTHSHEKIQSATKDFSGLFPKKIVFEALLAFAKLLDAKAIFAVSNETHVYHSLRYLNRQKLMHADYSGFWKMLGGALSEDDNFTLNIDPVRKDIATIPSKKRSEYRRRYKLLDDLSHNITKNFYL
jgi:uncharacterized protein VirK/YbjX